MLRGKGLAAKEALKCLTVFGMKLGAHYIVVVACSRPGQHHNLPFEKMETYLSIPRDSAVTALFSTVSDLPRTHGRLFHPQFHILIV